MNNAPSLVAAIFREPASIGSLGLSEWDLLVRQARRTQLLARLQVTLVEHGLLGDIPEPARRHLNAARTVSDAHSRAVHWELDRIARALKGIDTPVVVLKGAAYLAAGLPAGRGRTFNDVDIMVPKNRLREAEEALRRHGWASATLDEYDQRYYRTWMHEIPPMRHVKRQTVLDLHHTILPETARLRPNPEALFEAAHAVDGYDNLYILAPTDIVLHSATHLFHDGEFEHGLRDLVDLDALLRHFGENERFWFELLKRAETLDLVRPLFYALRYARQVLSTPVPEGVLTTAHPGRPGQILTSIMDRIFALGLQPDHASCDTPLTGFARWCLYVRGHYLRMPLYLLIPHLMRKSFRRHQEV